jgi:hypothetical protein
MTQDAITTTLYIRCAGLHSRGELLNDFFYAHRSALGLENYYEATSSSLGSGVDQDAERVTADNSADAATAGGERVATSSFRLPADFPVEVVFVRQSRKPYFLVEWRYPTQEEVAKQRAKDAATTGDQRNEGEGAAPLEAESNTSSSSTANRLPSTLLADLARRTLALGRSELSGDALMWRDQPVTINAALAGMSVAAERTKLELRDAQLKTQRVAEKRARDEAGAAAGTAKKATDSEKPTSAFVPRSVRRRA